MKPSWIACWVTENAPEMTAWLAMIVATVARMTSGRRSTSGASRKNGFLTVSIASAGAHATAASPPAPCSSAAGPA